METYEKKYKEANDKIAARFGTNVAKEIFTDLYESEDEKVRKAIIELVRQSSEILGMQNQNNMLVWLEKQRDKPLFTYDDILALQCCMETSKKVQEDKELLLKDLCARLPYDVMVNVDGYGTEKLIGIENETITTKATPTSYSDKGEYPIDIVKPYLRPMSSMTEEELYEIQEILGKGVEIHDGFISIAYSSINTFSYLELKAVFDWFNAYHFDYRGLIERGSAIKVTEENNPYKK